MGYSKMKVLLGVLGLALGTETSLKRSRRQAGSTCDEIKQVCNLDVSDGIYMNMAECLQDSDTLGLCSAGGDDQCQNYQYDGFKLCCPDGLDVDHFWPRVRTTLQRGPRPLAPNEQCPNGCDVASTVDKFVCAYFKRVGELKQLFEELETFTDMDLKSIIDFKRQFVRRYNEVNAKSQRSLRKMIFSSRNSRVKSPKFKLRSPKLTLILPIFINSAKSESNAQNNATSHQNSSEESKRTVLIITIPTSGHKLVSISSNQNQISPLNMLTAIKRLTVVDGLSF